MIREYLDEILEGKKTYDARSYGTNKRGTIALVDTRKSAVIGLIDLVGTHKGILQVARYRKMGRPGIPSRR